MLLINIGSTSCGGNVVRVNGVSTSKRRLITDICIIETSAHLVNEVRLRRDWRQDFSQS